MKSLQTIAFMGIFMAGCSMPTTKAVSGSDRPTLRLIGAPAGSELLIDGKNIGAADRFDGVNGVLTLNEGPHTVDIKQGNVVLRRQHILATSGEMVSVEMVVGGAK